MPPELPDRFEAGTLSTPAIVSLAAGIRFVQKIGADEIAEREAALVSYARERLADIHGVTVYGDPAAETSVLSFRVDGTPPEETARSLDRAGIAVRAGLHCAPLAHRAIGTFPLGTVRLGFGAFNTEKDVDRVLLQIKKVR